MSEKTKAEMLREELFYKKQSLFEIKTEEELSAAKDYSRGYCEYLDNSKTEREAVKTTVNYLADKGFVPYELGDKIEVGGKYYLNNRDKSIFAFRVGTEALTEGMRICAAHIDSPRLDLKQHPLFEDGGMAYLKTHYYGGIRKYQWPTIPLALHGVVTKRNGETVEITVGEEAGDPVFVITDLLPHLGREQAERKLSQAFTGEGLNLLVGSAPYFEDGKAASVDEKVKLSVLAMLNEKYGITEADFMSAELCAVPAGRAVDIGLDRWLVGGYGHDDKVCAYPALTALTDTETAEHTVMCVLADKEETGSDGTTGMQCSLLVDLMDEICKCFGVSGAVCRSKSMCLSADVSAGFDPLYPEVYEKRNSAIVHAGVVMNKYTGSGGKYSTSDASAEYVAKIRAMFDADNVVWQTAELGKIDAGGGGTVAKYVANCNIDTVDLGVPVLSMHAPFEVISKADLFETYKAFKAFCK